VTGSPAPSTEVRSEILKASNVERQSPAGTAQPGVDDENVALAGLPRRFVGLLLDVVSGAVLASIGAFGLLQILASWGVVGPADDPRPLTILVSLGIFLLYLAFGWSKGETLGMLVTRTRLLRPEDRRPAGLGRAFMRAVGAYVTFGLGLLAFAIITFVNLNLTFIQGTADLAVRIGAVVVGLYVIWLGSGQRIVARPRRQSLADRIGGTIVAIRR